MKLKLVTTTRKFHLVKMAHKAYSIRFRIIAKFYFRKLNLQNFPMEVLCYVHHVVCMASCDGQLIVK